MGKFNSIDMKALKLTGLTDPNLYVIILVISIAIMLFIDVMIFKFYMLIPLTTTNKVITTLVCIASAIDVFRKKSVVKMLANFTFDVTPIRIVIRDDQIVYDKAIAEIMKISKNISFEGVEVYHQLNKKVSLKTNQEIIRQIKAETLKAWLSEEKNLMDAIELIIECHSTEKILRVRTALEVRSN